MNCIRCGMCGNDIIGADEFDSWELEPQKSSVAQMPTYIASNGLTNEKFEIRYENENIWMGQKDADAHDEGKG